MEIQHPGMPEGPRNEGSTPPRSGNMAGRLFRHSAMMAAFPPVNADRVAQQVNAIANDSLFSTPDILPAETSMEETPPLERRARVFTPITSPPPTSPRSLSPEEFRQAASGMRSGMTSPLFSSPPPAPSYYTSPSGTPYLLPDPPPVAPRSAASTSTQKSDQAPLRSLGAKGRSMSVISVEDFERQQRKIPEKLRVYPEQIQGALVVANKHKTLPTLKAERVEDITLNELKAPIMIGKDREGKPFITICYESNGEVDFDVIYRFRENEWTNTRQATSQIFSTTEKEQELAVRHEEIWGVKRDPLAIRFAKRGQIEERLLQLVRGEDVPILIEIAGSADYKQPNPSSGGPTVHLYDPKKKNRVMPWDRK